MTVGDIFTAYARFFSLFASSLPAAVGAIPLVLRQLSARLPHYVAARLPSIPYRSDPLYGELYQSMTSCALTISVRKHPEERFTLVDCNRSFVNAEAINPAWAAGRDLREVFPGIEDTPLLEAVRDVYHTGNTRRHLEITYPAGHDARHRRVNLYRLSDKRVVCLWADVTGEVAQADALRRAQQHDEELVRNLPAAVIVHRRGRILFINPAAMSKGKYALPDLLGKHVSDLLPGPTGRWLRRSILRRDDDDPVPDFELDIPIGDGTYRRFLIRSAHISYHGAPAILALLTDITERRAIEQALRQSEEKFQKAFDASPAPMALVKTRSGEIVEANRSFTKVFGYGPEDLKSADVAKAILGPQAVNVVADALRLQKYDIEAQVYTKDGRPLTCLLSARTIEIDRDRCAIVSAVDITERKQTEDQIRQISYHDALTGVHNRAYCELRMANTDTPENQPYSVVMADVNGLKLVNDGFGHKMGDELLKSVTTIMRSVCRSGDFVARWAGDEFVILLPKTSERAAQRLSHRLHQALRESNPIVVQPSVAVGVATKTNEGESLHEVLGRAEERMYRNKMVSSKSVRNALVSGLVKTLHEKTYETEEHLTRLAGIVNEFGVQIGLLPSELDELALLATMHDIGKLAIPDEVLQKPDPLDEHDWRIIRRHPEIGYRIADSTPGMRHIAESILSHHERWDGFGYPRGLRGEEIPLPARIIAIADSYEAMTGKRLYRAGLSPWQAICEIEKGAGTQFDPSLAPVFCRLWKEKNGML